MYYMQPFRTLYICVGWRAKTGDTLRGSLSFLFLLNFILIELPQKELCKGSAGKGLTQNVPLLWNYLLDINFNFLLLLPAESLIVFGFFDQASPIIL